MQNFADTAINTLLDQELIPHPYSSCSSCSSCWCKTCLIKPKSLSFQSESGWNVAQLFFKIIHINSKSRYLILHHNFKICICICTCSIYSTQQTVNCQCQSTRGLRNTADWVSLSHWHGHKITLGNEHDQEHGNKKLSYCWETVRRESMPRIAACQG